MFCKTTKRNRSTAFRGRRQTYINFNSTFLSFFKDGIEVENTAEVISQGGGTVGLKDSQVAENTYSFSYKQGLQNLNNFFLI